MTKCCKTCNCLDEIQDLQNQINNSEAFPIEAGRIIKKAIEDIFNKST